MYHSISEANEDHIHPYYRVNTAPDIFSRHIRFLHENNYSVINLSEAADRLTINDTTTQPLNHSTTQRRFVVLTFDDGFADFYTDAFPILQKYKFSATVFLPTGFMSSKEGGFKGKRCLDWQEVKSLAASGIEFGSHTVTHRKLSELAGIKSMWKSRIRGRFMEDKIGQRVSAFSYPYAFPEENSNFRARLRISLTESGYSNGVTTMIGTVKRGDDQLFLRRIPVNSDDDLAFFQGKLEGGYDWMKVHSADSKCSRDYDSEREWLISYRTIIACTYEEFY